MTTAANGVACSAGASTVRAEKPHAGASGVPFMNRITLCSAIASEIASRIGFASPAGDGAAALATGWPGDIGSSVEGVVRDMAGSWLIGWWSGAGLRGLEQGHS